MAENSHALLPDTVPIHLNFIPHGLRLTKCTFIVVLTRRSDRNASDTVVFTASQSNTGLPEKVFTVSQGFQTYCKIHFQLKQPWRL